MIKTNCFKCNKNILVQIKLIRNFCSRKCFGIFRRKPFKKCQQCNKHVNWRGKQIRACSLKCRNILNRGKGNPNYKKGWMIQYGYKLILLPINERNGRKKKYLEEHRYIIEKHIGRRLKKGEVVPDMYKAFYENLPDTGVILSRGDTTRYQLPVGQKVRFGKHSGQRFKFNGKDLQLVREHDILASIG